MDIRLSTNTPSRIDSQGLIGSIALVQNLAVLAFGALIIYAVGFSPISAAHNAAHDTRHTMAFPCH